MVEPKRSHWWRSKSSRRVPIHHEVHQRLLQALYLIPQASVKLVVKAPLLATRKDELGADKNSEYASIAH